MTTNHLGLEHSTERFMARLAEAYQGRLASSHLIVPSLTYLYLNGLKVTNVTYTITK